MSIEKRIAERKAELEMLQSGEPMSQTEKKLMEAPEVILLTCEFLCAFIGIMFALAGKPMASVPCLLVAIYLKIKR